jgi:hypothetical protein
MYLLCFSWRIREDDDEGRPGKSKAMRQEIPIEISQKFADEYKKHRLNMKINDASELSTNVRDKLIEKKMEGQFLHAFTGEGDSEKVNPATAAKEYIKETIESARMLGLSPIAQQTPQPIQRIEWDKIIPALAPIVVGFLTMQQDAERRRSEDFNKMLMLMMTQGQNATGQMFEMMKLQSGQGSGGQAFKEMKDMIMGALDLKSVLAGNEKETLSDKIFRVVEGVAPQILSIAANAAQAQAARNTMPVKMAKGYIDNDPDFAALKQNPVEMKAFIEKMDGFFGWRQTDVVLAVADWQRPAECPRDPMKEHPAAAPSNDTADTMTE